MRFSERAHQGTLSWLVYCLIGYPDIATQLSCSLLACLLSHWLSRYCYSAFLLSPGLSIVSSAIQILLLSFPALSWLIYCLISYPDIATQLSCSLLACLLSHQLSRYCYSDFLLSPGLSIVSSAIQILLLSFPALSWLVYCLIGYPDIATQISCSLLAYLLSHRLSRYCYSAFLLSP